jgi:UDP-N-acetylmuramoyl-tripeptide--D-alanyl-D-alanine ligase
VINSQIGKKIAKICNFALIIGKTNQKALNNGLIDGGMTSNNIFLCQNLDEAIKKLPEITRYNDVVLLEND